LVLRFNVFAFNVTPVTVAVSTVTAHAALLLPSTVMTVIVAVPSDTAVTMPLLDTVATVGSLLSQVTDLLVAFEGEMVAVST
jgi:hypothetical protein